ncbi:hypothetical protein K469DRAFT_701027 [Zopfia rhizophila CBS 207.26]|uniref:Uncharacterized protein n=1 Tax=Zopfia rhizophila CBS 207.26 TaxID=1314779 RepID=A0A6A6EGI7_9PEZI|nr:hypothetical protein K469DRAFT_701027 [Zopfia rhizophila CBS 207.26]
MVQHVGVHQQVPITDAEPQILRARHVDFTDLDRGLSQQFQESCWLSSTLQQRCLPS